MISFVYFDLGGVLVRDFSGTDNWNVMKREFGVPEKRWKEFDDLYDTYEMEDVCLTRDVDTLIPIFAERFGIQFPKGYSWLSDFVSKFERNPSIYPIIKHVQKNCRTGILTNMYPRMFDAIEEAGLLPPYSWDVIIDSTVVGFQKPDKKIFMLAEKLAGVKKKEILFIENTKENIEGAKAVGWQTFWYDSSDHEESCRKLATFLETVF
jgi:FMN phosphatase YigB (HAD superfamily)